MKNFTKQLKYSTLISLFKIGGRFIFHKTKKFNKTFKDKLFQCIQCGRCCKNTYRRRRILLTETDLQAILTVTDLEKAAFTKKRRVYDIKPFKYTMQMRDGACVFSKNNKCGIYSSRPLICRSYPLWITQEDEMMTIHVDEECPGLSHGEGTVLDNKYIKGILKKVKKAFANENLKGNNIQ